MENNNNKVAAAKLKDLVNNYKTVFGSDEGKTVMSDLEKDVFTMQQHSVKTAQMKLLIMKDSVRCFFS